MNITQALVIVKDHIRIGKGMELTNGVPEALERVVEELEQHKKALELAIKWNLLPCCPVEETGKEYQPPECKGELCTAKDSLWCWKDYFTQQAKAGDAE